MDSQLTLGQYAFVLAMCSLGEGTGSYGAGGRMTMVNVPWEKTAVVVDTQKDWDEFITYIRSLGYGVTSLESTHKTLYILGVRAATVVLHQPPEIIAMAAVGQADVVLSSKPLLDKLAWLRATIGDPS